ncbi:hypothetical protein ACJVC5_10555 [Peredibacter sp. HCB2-198]|uniref:hypothetical protein n=1 Tax=Peredibacter sp. HCB2-198 TaxID=3383025 RepID=UPI0038B53D40
MRFIAAFALFTSFSAMACPDLSGTYTACRSQTGSTAGSTDVVITQAIQNRATTYSMTSTDPDTNERKTETYRADGRIVSETITDPDSGMTISMSSVVKCVNNTVNMNMKVTMAGQQVANVTTVMSKANKQLTMKMTGKNFDEPINETLICE